jgi:hypothetical protein
MATTKNNALLSGFSGRIGKFVVYELNGKQVIRSMPKTKRNPKISPLQQIHHNSFKAQTQFAQGILGNVIRPIWGLMPNTDGLTYYHRFLKVNKMAFNNTDRIVFPELLSLTIGTLSPATDMLVVRQGNQILLSWNSQHIHYCMLDEDQLHIALLKNRESLVLIKDVALRADSQCAQALPTDMGDYCEGYLYWSSPDHKMFSPSVYWRV